MVTGYAILYIFTLIGLSKNVYILFIPGFLVFAANGMLSVLTTLFLANTCDYNEWKNGHRDESVIFSMQTFVVKLAAGLSAFIAGMGLDLIGLVGNGNESGKIVKQSAATLTGLRTLMAIFPMILLVVAFLFFLKKYILTEEKLEEIQKEIGE